MALGGSSNSSSGMFAVGGITDIEGAVFFAQARTHRLAPCMPGDGAAPRGVQAHGLTLRPGASGWLAYWGVH